MTGPFNFDFESFKQELLKEMRDKTWQMIRDMVAEMVGKMTLGGKNSETRTVVDEPSKEKLKAPADPTRLEWVKNTQRQVDQLQIALKEHGLNPNFVDLDLDLKKEEPLPPKYKFLNMKKYFSTDDPHLHLKQYVTYMKAIELFKA